MSRRAYVWTALALATILFFGLNIFTDNFFTDARLDLTQNGAYTLSSGTRNIVAKLPEPVTLRFYFSKKNSAQYPVIATYANRVRDLLGEYVAMSHGKIILEEIDPEPFTPEEDQATAAGIRAQQVGDTGTLYFGIEGTNSIDNKQPIPYLAVEREAYLEYDLTSLIYQLSHPEKPKLAVISSLPLAGTPTAPGQPAQPMTIYAQLQQEYAVSMLAQDFAAIPDDTSLLMIVHPGNLSAPQVRAIETFTIHGGKALVFVDPLSEVSRRQNNPMAVPQSDLPDLFKGWGVTYNAEKIVLDNELAQHIQTGDPGQGPMPYPMWLRLTPDDFAPRDPVTGNMQTLNMASVGAFMPIKGAATRFEPLIQSSAQAALQDRASVMSLMNDPSTIEPVKASGQRYAIAARITGRASFPGVGEGNVNVIAVADTDIFDDRFWIRQGQGVFADNGNFVLSAVENLTGSDDLISLRMRGNTERPFTRVRAMEQDAAQNYRDTLTNLQAKLTSSQQEMAQLQRGGSGGATGSVGATSLTAAQTADIERVRREIAGTRAVLRDVQHRLRADIDRLGVILAAINILLMPLLVAGFAILFGLRRRKRAMGGGRKNAGART